MQTVCIDGYPKFKGTIHIYIYATCIDAYIDIYLVYTVCARDFPLTCPDPPLGPHRAELGGGRFDAAAAVASGFGSLRVESRRRNLAPGQMDGMCPFFLRVRIGGGDFQGKLGVSVFLRVPKGEIG